MHFIIYLAFLKLLVITCDYFVRKILNSLDTVNYYDHEQEKINRCFRKFIHAGLS